MFFKNKRRRMIKHLLTGLDQCLNGHSHINRLRLLEWYDQVSQQAIRNGKVIKPFGSKQMTMLHWIETRRVYFTDNTSVPVSVYESRP